jgi:hypothetical protein
MTLELWGAIAASVLLVQCIVFNLIWVALALGLWKGSEWVRKNTSAGLQKADYYLQKGVGAVHKGEQYLSAPFVRTRGRTAGWRALLRALKG